jgi:hypothetical protein
LVSDALEYKKSQLIHRNNDDTKRTISSTSQGSASALVHQFKNRKEPHTHDGGEDLDALSEIENRLFNDGTMELKVRLSPLDRIHAVHSSL